MTSRTRLPAVAALSGDAMPDLIAIERVVYPSAIGSRVAARCRRGESQHALAARVGRPDKFVGVEERSGARRGGPGRDCLRSLRSCEQLRVAARVRGRASVGLL